MGKGGPMAGGIVFCSITKLDFKIGSMLRNTRTNRIGWRFALAMVWTRLLWEGAK